MKCQERWVLIEKQLMEKLGSEPKPGELERVVRVTPATITKVAKKIYKVFMAVLLSLCLPDDVMVLQY